MRMGHFPFITLVYRAPLPLPALEEHRMLSVCTYGYRVCMCVCAPYTTSRTARTVKHLFALPSQKCTELLQRERVGD